jgi:large subunit ribosomal protein L7e
MLSLNKHAKIQELRLRLIELLRERLPSLTPRNTSRSTKLPIKLSSSQREMPRLLDPSSLTESQRLLLLLELEGKYQKHFFGCYYGNYKVQCNFAVFLTCILYSINKLAPKPKKILQLLRLRQIHNGVFVKLNKATWNMIKMVEPFITYGYPSRQTISKLVYKRGYGKCDRRRIPLTDNSIIATELGKHGINCVEDLIHEIVTCGPKFKEANNFLWPFKLSSPLGGFEVKRHSFIQGFGAFGNREELINKVVAKMI